MKIYFNLIILLNSFLFVPLKAQTKIDTCQYVILKGYIIKQYKKNDIDEIKLNSQNVIDFYKKTFFVPIGNNVLTTKAFDTINVFNPNEVYFLPSEETNYFMNKYCSINNKYKFSNLKFNLEFFKIGKGQDEFLYKIYYAEYKALKKQILNNSVNTFQLNIPYNKKNKFITCYFIYQDLILQEIEKINDENFSRIR